MRSVIKMKMNKNGSVRSKHIQANSHSVGVGNSEACGIRGEGEGRMKKKATSLKLMEVTLFGDRSNIAL